MTEFRLPTELGEDVKRYLKGDFCGNIKEHLLEQYNLDIVDVRSFVICANTEPLIDCTLEIKIKDDKLLRQGDDDDC